jgi:hypothetical protein
MTGHHRTVPNTYINGILVGATPSFVAAEPFASFTYNSATYQPMIEEKTALVNMLSGLSSAQLTTAQLSTTYTDLVCGPGKDWLFRPPNPTESKQFNNRSETARITMQLQLT